MDYLFEIFSSLEIEEVFNYNNLFHSLNIDDIKQHIAILRSINCHDNDIRNIILSYPEYLNRSITDVEHLISKLRDLGIEDLDVVFDSYPYLLSKNDFEIEKFINDKVKDGYDFLDIVDELESTPYVID